MTSLAAFLSPPQERPSLAPVWITSILVLLVLGNWSIPIIQSEDYFQDLFIYSRGANLPWKGLSAYDGVSLAELVAKHYPQDQGLQQNHGFFLSPQAVIIFAFADQLDWYWLKISWTMFMVALLFVISFHLLRLGRFPSSSLEISFVLFAVGLNPLSRFVLLVGQTSIFTTTCLLWGWWLLRRAHPWLAALVWSLMFIKPHLALVTFLLAWKIGGLKQLFRLSFAVLCLNLLASWSTSGSGQLLADFLHSVQRQHGTVIFNTILANEQISSWNRLWFAAGGQAMEINAYHIVVGYLVWFFLMTIVDRRAKNHPSRQEEWSLACVVIAAPLICPLLPYELLILFAVIPWLRGLYHDRRPIIALGSTLLLIWAFLPGGSWETGGWSHALARGLGGFIDSGINQIGGTTNLEELLHSHRSVTIFLLAMTILLSRLLPEAQPSVETSPQKNLHLARDEGVRGE